MAGLADDGVVPGAPPCQDRAVGTNLHNVILPYPLVGVGKQGQWVGRGWVGAGLPSCGCTVAQAGGAVSLSPFRGAQPTVTDPLSPLFPTRRCPPTNPSPFLLSGIARAIRIRGHPQAVR